MTSLLKVPYLGTAEDDVLLAEWFVGEGDAFRKGEAIAVVETLKATFEVEAEADGVLHRQIVEEGTRVPLQAALGVIGAPGEAADDAAIEALMVEAAASQEVVEDIEPAEPAQASTVSASGGSDAPVAPAARRVASELGVDLSTVRGTGPNGLVRVEDVEAAAAGGGAGATVVDGNVDPAFLDHIRADRAAFAALASDFKVALYRKHGAILGNGTHIAPGAMLLVDKLVTGDDAFFGPDTSVEARSLQAGDLLHFGRNCAVRCTKIVCGDNAFFTDDIEIGGGGALEPEAELIVGSHGFVGEHVHLNPCRRLEIGDEVVISRNAVVMTHSFGGSILKGYPNRFSGVRIGSFSQVGILATLFPGVEMGEGSILLSGSSLVSSMPAGRMFGGVPAVDMKSAAQALSDEAFAGIARELVWEFGRQLRLRGREVTTAESENEIVQTVANDGQRHVLRFGMTALADYSDAVAEEVRAITNLDDAAWDAAPSDVVTIDLATPRIQGLAGPLASAFREFLRKRGVRLRPRSWAYKGGWL